MRVKGPEIIVNGGVDIDNPRLSRRTEDLNTDTAESTVLRTNILQKNVKKNGLWEVSMQDIRTGKVYHKRFRNYLEVGRPYGKARDRKRLEINASREISGRHCAFGVRDGHVWIRDLGSRNGTTLNGQLVTDELMLPETCRIGLGSVIFATTFVKD